MSRKPCHSGPRLRFLTSLLPSLLFCLGSASCPSTYYVDSVGGDDAHDGLSEAAAWRTLDKVNSATYEPGDTIRFKRGAVWRGYLTLKGGRDGAYITYSAYGTGDLPRILGSVNLSGTDDWIDEGGGIWRSREPFDLDVGNIIFDHGTFVGTKKWSQAELQTPGDFWYDRDGAHYLRLYSTLNPAQYSSDIECALNRHMATFSGQSYLIVEYLSFAYGGAHAFSGHDTSHIILRDLEISYIGGGDMDLYNGHTPNGEIRWGNGIEFWGNAKGHIVERNTIWEIYDSGLSNQNNEASRHQSDIMFQNNKIWNCGLACIEFWMAPASSSLENIGYEYNTCVDAGAGWGYQRPEKYGAHLVIYSTPAAMHDIRFVNNVFYNTVDSDAGIYPIYLFSNTISDPDQITVNYNGVYQSGSAKLLAVFYSDGTEPEITDTFAYDSADIARFVAGTGMDSSSVFADPLLRDVEAVDFHLQEGSPLIDAALPSQVASDFDGVTRPQGSGYDIGAFECY